MAGRGFAPKPPDRRAGHSKDSVPRTSIAAAPVKQPALPKKVPGLGVPYPAQTKAWWRRWRDYPLSAQFTETDWSELLDTSIAHARLWATGDTKQLPELRLRAAKFCATLEDRARARIDLVPPSADGSPAAAPSARERRGALRIVSGE